jgi:hypothetical protein
MVNQSLLKVFFDVLLKLKLIFFNLLHGRTERQAKEGLD